MLRALWASAYGKLPLNEATEVKGWKDMGWQGNHPATDFRWGKTDWKGEGWEGGREEGGGEGRKSSSGS